MLTITCKHEEKESVREQLVLSLLELVRDTNFEALTFSYMDDYLKILHVAFCLIERIALEKSLMDMSHASLKAGLFCYRN